MVPGIFVVCFAIVFSLTAINMPILNKLNMVLFYTGEVISVVLFFVYLIG
jgi:hypothetical protein